MAKSMVVDEVATVGHLLEPLTAARIALEQRASRLTEKRHDKVATQVNELRSESSVIRQTQHQHQYETTKTLATIDYTTGRINQQTNRIESKMDTFVSDGVAYVDQIHKKNVALEVEVAQLKMLNAFHMLAEEKRRNRRFYNEGEYLLYK